TLDDGISSLSATYSGDASNTASASAVLSEQVITAPVNIAVGSSAASVKQGKPLTLTAHVTGDHAGGTVAFVSGTVTPGPATIVNGVATLTVTALDLAAGARNIVAVYMGDASNAATISQPIVLNVSAGIATDIAGQGVADRTITRIEDRDGRL